MLISECTKETCHFRSPLHRRQECWNVGSWIITFLLAFIINQSSIKLRLIVHVVGWWSELFVVEFFQYSFWGGQLIYLWVVCTESFLKMFKNISKCFLLFGNLELSQSSITCNITHQMIMLASDTSRIATNQMHANFNTCHKVSPGFDSNSFKWCQRISKTRY